MPFLMLAKCAEAQAAANTPLQLYLNTILLSWLRCGTDRTSRKAGGLLLASIIRSRSFETEFVHAESSRPISAACGLHGRCRRDLGRFARRALPRRIQGARSGKKLSTYECGFNAFDDARMRFDVRFYLVSLLFIIFDLEVAFLFPWAVAFREVGAFGFWSMMIFLGVLTVGFIYEWRKGALEWD